ncbi:hypothetical protein V1512DRAFT_265626 [Lipomyces arxii]|uniref:uncharacterized protein n=1 Tax=Lipomyces arxii TaxID=56418 RepID=UPI0034CD7FAA
MSKTIQKGGGSLAAPSIPRSEEIKYRQKCKDLKKRIQNIEEQNDILTLRLSRSRRAVQRMRLERALLLEKLEERTFLKVDDSDGSPSPPPSPPRIHVRHRRRDSDGSLSPGADPATIASNNGTAKANASGPKKKHVPRDPNAPKRPQNAYIIFCDHEKERVRAQLDETQPGENYDLTRAMAEAWRDLGDEGRKPYYEMYDAEKARYNREMQAYYPSGGAISAPNVPSAAESSPTAVDEPEGHIELVAQPVEEAVTVAEDEEDEDMENVSFGGGFTAVNKR